ncbi:amidohydrolase [Rhodococcus fascians]|nr:amidohydrolase [Rhodococcus fascians]MBY4140890.1 amidohydrolase [Rhodococcus fascians]MBY4219554.1 amidohydrolase [Rhodococcus fascians]MBY4221863.1 amidohydrolase [Rhodococcus fascians]MBY4233864.1 amidohydrolase [Rhodococcus fascians]
MNRSAFSAPNQQDQHISTNGADTVYRANPVVTFDPERPRAEAVAVKDGSVVAVGSTSDVEQWIGRDTDVVDFGNAALLPGLTDAHVHPIWGVTSMAIGIDLTGLDTMQSVTTRLQEGEPVGPDEWVLGWGLDPNVFDGPMSGRSFEETLQNRPVYLRLRDVHSAIVSPRALELAGITGRETFADKSSVDLADDGMPSGLLLELSAMALIESYLPSPTFEETTAAVLSQLRTMASVGLTGGHVMDFVEGSRDILDAIERTTDLPVRLRFSPMCTPDMDEDRWSELLDLQGLHGRRWYVEGIKFMIDGTIDNGTAWLEEPDIHGENTEAIWKDPATYQRAVRYFIGAGVPTATHAIGDAAVRYVLDAIGGAEKVRPDVPNRIEHIETIPDDLVHEFARLGVVASMQPIHATHHTRADRTDNWSARLGDERASHGWRCRDLRDIGVTLALGSDWPVTPVDPRAMMADSQLRRPVAKPDVEPVQPEQALTALMAYEGYTTHAALAAGQQNSEGKIKVGHRADFTVLASDPLQLTAEAQAVNSIVSTVIDGRIQFSDGQLRGCRSR